MAEDNDGPIHRWTPLDVRIEAVERFADCTEHLLTVGDLQWADVAKDFRLLAVNSSLRRQQESEPTTSWSYSWLNMAAAGSKRRPCIGTG
ncbi:hypothetical protein MPY17_20020 [Rhodococcus opacus]|uniref:hypothetical protein n=1 Tax=Rhodococcus opacus TaxID=37919 RepID=UPI001FF11B54|nr:hypothetical protein [Rhodococcus opacus]UOT01316.1 hypothetical protein MPY17_20020 [Rhodococcus opacus]